MKTFNNWFVGQIRTEFRLIVGERLFTGHGRNDTVGEYVITEINEADDRTVHIVCTRIKDLRPLPTRRGR